MSVDHHRQAVEAVAVLTGVQLCPQRVLGRNVWGRIALNRTGMAHIEFMAGDKDVNAAVMPTISAEEMALPNAERLRLYKERCREAAKSMNNRIIEENRLVLLMSSNSHLTKAAKSILRML